MINGEVPYPGKPQFTKSTEDVGEWKDIYTISLRPQEECKHRTPGGVWERGADGSMHLKWKQHKLPARPDDKLNQINPTPAWCGGAYAAIRGAQSAWNEEGPMQSLYMATIGGKKKTSQGCYNEKLHEPQPMYRPDNREAGIAGSRSTDVNLTGPPGSPVRDMNILGPTRIY